MGKLYIIGMGPGKREMMTFKALSIIEKCNVIAGYTVYINILKDNIDLSDKELIVTGMRQEKERCISCIKRAKDGDNVALISSGDAGVYGMASLVMELSLSYEFDDIEVIPGITAAISGAAVLGAPINHDFCVISLSDLLTPFELIEKRLKCAAEGDFAIALYNPSSHKRNDYLAKARDILLTILPKDRPSAYVKNIGREGEEYHILKLSELSDDKVDMFTTVFIGNSRTRIINGRLVTPRGYDI